MKNTPSMEKRSPLLLIGLLIIVAIIGAAIVTNKGKAWRNTGPSSMDFYKTALSAYLDNDLVTARSMVAVALTFDPENLEAQRLRDRLRNETASGLPPAK